MNARKITPDVRDGILRAREQGVVIRRIAEDLGVSKQSIHDVIRKNQKWKIEEDKGPSVRMNFQIGRDLYDEVTAHCEACGISMSGLIRRLLLDHLTEEEKNDGRRS